MAKMSKADYSRMLSKKAKKRYKMKREGPFNVKLLEAELPYLVTLSKIIKNRNQKNAMIDNITPRQLATVKHLVKCFLDHKIKLPSSEMIKLKRDKRYLYGIASNRINSDLKKKILKQKGGFLGSIIGAVIPTVVGAVGKIFGL